jgi:conjugal transfer pilus assembly protein TraV
VIRPALMAAVAGTVVSGCATLGGNVAGAFSCRAPAGSCAPTALIDQSATEAEKGTFTSPGLPVRVGKGVPSPARTLERTVRIVFPAYIDASGILHEEATAYAVVEGPSWATSPNSSSVFSRSPAPSSLREAVAGASAPATEGLESLPTQAPHPIDGAAPADRPGPAALDAARAGHRIGRGALTSPPLSRSGEQPLKPHSAKAPSTTTPGQAGGRSRTLPTEPPADASDSGDIFTRVPPRGERP